MGDGKRRERAADDDGSDKEGEGGQGDVDGNEGGGQQRGQERRREGWRWRLCPYEFFVVGVGEN